MMSEMKYVRRAFLVLLLPGLMAAGCSDATHELTLPQSPQQGAEGQQASGDDPAKTPADSSAMQSEIYVRLLISAGNAAGTRADNEPKAGETGDGVETGVGNENTINDLTVFMYQDNSDPMQGINAPANTPIIHAAYFNTTVTDLSTVETGFLDGSTTIEESIHGGLANGTVVEYQAKFYHGPSFSENELGKLKILVVANAGDLTKVGPLGTLRDHLVQKSVNDNQTIVMTNERDIIVGADGAYTGIGSKEAPFEYHVDLERLAARIDFDKQNAEADMTDGLHYAVGTTADLYIEQIRIVNGAIEPSYLIKRVAPSIGEEVTCLGDETTTAGTPAIPNNYVVEPHSAQKVAANKEVAAFLEARYGASRLSESLTPATFFPGTTYEVDKTAAQTWKLGYVNENTFAASETCKEFATGLLLKGTYVPRTVYSDKDLTVATYSKGTTFWRYQPKTGDEAQSLYFTTKAAANDYVLAGHPGTITEYPNGVCYYYIWIRHANNNVENTYCPMEYAIVRNNIYRIYVESLTGPGSPNPDPEDPENMKAKIFVRKWREVVHPEIKL